MSTVYTPEQFVEAVLSRLGIDPQITIGDPDPEADGQRQYRYTTEFGFVITEPRMGAVFFHRSGCAYPISENAQEIPEIALRYLTDEAHPQRAGAL